MAEPTEADDIRLRRAGRYIKGRPHGISRYGWQERPKFVTAFTDSDWAGCVKTRRSTLGGLIMHGGHCVHNCSGTQHSIAAPSGEAELNAISKATGGGDCGSRYHRGLRERGREEDLHGQFGGKPGCTSQRLWEDKTHRNPTTMGARE